jgi:predicted transcriptional regulator
MTFNKIKQLILLTLISLTFSGCAAAMIPMMVASYATSGFLIFKTVQTSTGGSVNISFTDNEISVKNKIELSEIAKPGIWADNNAEVYAAEKMENARVFDLVITPARTAKAILKLELVDQMNSMTNSERLNAFKLLCEETGADSMIAFKNMGTEADTSIWSFSRAHMTHRSKMLIYSYKANRILYETTMEIKSEISSTIHNDQEILKIAGEAAAEKIILLTSA